MSPINQLPDNLSRLCLLPKEVILKILDPLTLQERLDFILAYPKHEELGRDFSLKTEIVDSNIEISQVNLLKVLGPQQKHLKISLNYTDIFGAKRVLTIDAINYMCNLKEVKLKNCKINDWCCSCDYMKKQNCFINSLLTRVERLTFDSCTLLSRNQRFMELHRKIRWRDWYMFLSFYENHVFNKASELKEVTFLNTLPMLDYWDLMRIIMDFKSFSNEQKVCVEVVNLEGESFILSKLATQHALSSVHGEFLPVYVHSCASAFYKAMEPPRPNISEVSPGIYNFFDNLAIRTLKKVDVKISETRIIHLRITDDFDMDRLKTEAGRMRCLCRGCLYGEPV